MKLNKLLPALLFVIIAVFTYASCDIDPWTREERALTTKKATGEVQFVQNTDKVIITKTTRFGKNKDGQPYKGQVGAVTMSHKTHEEMGMKCVDCHHKVGNDAREKKCAACHNGDNGYEVMHGLCLDCHIAKKDGPQKCMGCH
ncbi:MAG: cytochrome c3 family protein [bacterium]|nr:cytochrome c3 family protein [bacterium]